MKKTQPEKRNGRSRPFAKSETEGDIRRLSQKRDVLADLHRGAGNRAVRRLFSSGFVRGKLKVSEAGDRYEREADETAERIMRMPEGERLSSPPSPDGDGGNAPASVSPALEARIDALRGGGRPLPPKARAFFEPRFGRDFSNVRIHTGGEAGRLAGILRARAFTRGADIAFAPGEYHPDTFEGKRLLAHELTHVMQKRTGTVFRKPAPQNPGGSGSGGGKVVIFCLPRYRRGKDAEFCRQACAEKSRLGSLAEGPYALSKSFLLQQQHNKFMNFMFFTHGIPSAIKVAQPRSKQNQKQNEKQNENKCQCDECSNVKRVKKPDREEYTNAKMLVPLLYPWVIPPSDTKADYRFTFFSCNVAGGSFVSEFATEMQKNLGSNSVVTATGHTTSGHTTRNPNVASAKAYPGSSWTVDFDFLEEIARGTRLSRREVRRALGGREGETGTDDPTNVAFRALTRDPELFARILVNLVTSCNNGGCGNRNQIERGRETCITQCNGSNNNNRIKRSCKIRCNERWHARLINYMNCRCGNNGGCTGFIDSHKNGYCGNDPLCEYNLRDNDVKTGLCILAARLIARMPSQP